MKNLVALFVVALFMVTSVQTVQAHVVIEPDAVEVTGPETKKDKAEVSISELPADVQASLRTEMANGWEAKKAWKIKGDHGKYYKIKLMKGDEMKKVKYKADGKAMTS